MTATNLANLDSFISSMEPPHPDRMFSTFPKPLLTPMPTPVPALTPILLGAVPRPTTGDNPDELIKDRFLCRGGGALLVGPTGIGKSTFAMQAAMCFAAGRDLFGIRPSRPLRSLIVQAENDDGDIAEMRDGILKGLKFTAAECGLAANNIAVFQEDTRLGHDFCRRTLAPLLTSFPADLVIIDPALAFLGGDAKSQKDVGEFLRGGLNPILHQYQCGAIVVHHTNKPPVGNEKPEWRAGDLAYLGGGSAEWANWARAVLAIRSLGSHEVFELVAAKRGRRLKWIDEDGQSSCRRLVAHAKGDGFCWRLADQKERPVRIGKTMGRPTDFQPASVLRLLVGHTAGLTSTEWKLKAARDLGCGRTKFYEVKTVLENEGRIKKAGGRWTVIPQSPESPESPRIELTDTSSTKSAL